ncbi:MAG: hypothetical protein K2F63_03320, partial [Muribaculaceae bacterium]|nr:hypothetical protein [Muribaculaceae bacterium]
MKKFTVISLTGLALALSIVGCNSSSSSSLEFENSSNVAISSFKLCKDDSILANLDTVFFSIDLDKGHIFNADSLPYGTKTDKLVPSVVTYGGASMMTLTEHRANGTDTVYDITEGCTDSINFENGPVLLDVTSVSGTVKKRYTIDVNVHKVVSDSLAWDRTAFTKLPSALASPKAQRTARTSKGAYCLTSDGSVFSLAFSANPDNAASWNISSVSLPTQADISSFAGTTDELFIIAGGILHKSTDGKAWTSTGVHMHAVYGAYGSELLGSVKSAGKWCTISYPSATTPVPV